MGHPSESQWQIVFAGEIIAVEKNSANGFERAVRSPGVRLILRNDKNEILLTKEFRPEHGRRDMRLPGGKVFDALADYLAARGDGAAVQRAVMAAGRAEAKQEAGVEEIGDLSLFWRSVAGTTIEWDLFYLQGNVLKIGSQDLRDDEVEGVEVGFYPKAELLKMLQSGEIAEDRTVAALSRYLSQI